MRLRFLAREHRMVYLQARRLKFDGRLADQVRINRGRPLIRRVRAYSANDNGSL